MKYPSIEKVVEICEPALANLPEIYKKTFRQEVKDLKKWNLFLQKDKASEILAQKGAGIDSNRSGSLILYLLGASTVDPLKADLRPMIQKFGKADPPDIDIDLHPATRDKVKAYLVDTFGQSKVCSVGTVGTYKTKNVIQDVARALGLDVSEAIQVTKNLESEIGEGDEETKIDKASFDEICEAQPELKAYFEAHEDVRTHAEVLRNQAKNYGTHAGGVIISNLDLTNRIPVFKDKEGRVVSSWAESGDYQELSSIGLVKFDVLGLCLEENTLVETDEGYVPIKDCGKKTIHFLNSDGEINSLSPDDFILIKTGERDLLELTLEGGIKILCSPDHQLFKKI